MSACTVELDGEQGVRGVLAVEPLVDNEVEVSGEGVVPVTVSEPGVGTPERAGSFSKGRNDVIGQGWPTGLVATGFSAAARTQSSTRTFCEMK